MRVTNLHIQGADRVAGQSSFPEADWVPGDGVFYVERGDGKLVIPVHMVREWVIPAEKPARERTMAEVRAEAAEKAKTLKPVIRRRDK